MKNGNFFLHAFLDAPLSFQVPIYFNTFEEFIAIINDTEFINNSSSCPMICYLFGDPRKIEFLTNKEINLTIVIDV